MKSDEILKKEAHVVSFSGGKDSTAMLLLMIEKEMRIDEIVFIDTTKEFPGMYKHIKQVEMYIQKPITTLKMDFDYYFSEHVKTKGKRKGEKGYGWPDFRNRWCTAIKRNLFQKFCKKQFGKVEIIEYHGIAIDERHRAKRNKTRNIRYPLIEWQITEREALTYCYHKGFNWDDLYRRFHRVSCWCCPLSRIGELKTLYIKYPELWRELVRMDKKTSRRFRPDLSISELNRRFAADS